MENLVRLKAGVRIRSSASIYLKRRRIFGMWHSLFADCFISLSVAMVYPALGMRLMTFDQLRLRRDALAIPCNGVHFSGIPGRRRHHSE